MKKQMFLYGHNVEVIVRQEPSLLGKFCAVVNYPEYPEHYSVDFDNNEEVAVHKAAKKLISSSPIESLKNLGYE